MVLDKVIAWRERNLNDRQMTSILAFAIGVLASLAAYVLHKLIALIQNLLTDGFMSDRANWLYLVFPVIGIWLTIFGAVVGGVVAPARPRRPRAIARRRPKLPMARMAARTKTARTKATSWKRPTTPEMTAAAVTIAAAMTAALLIHLAMRRPKLAKLSVMLRKPLTKASLNT